MPVYEVGGLVRFNPPGELFVSCEEDEDLNAVGLILEMRHMMHLQPEAKVMWSDMPEPRWIHLSSLAPMEPVQPDGEPGITR